MLRRCIIKELFVVICIFVGSNTFTLKGIFKLQGDKPMKKLLPTVLALMLILTACGTKAAEITSSPSHSPAATLSPSPKMSATPVSPSSSQLVAMKKVTSEVRQPTFCVLLSDYGSVINPWLSANGFKTINYDSLKNYEVSDQKCYQPNIAKGLVIALYTPPNSNELTQIVYRLDLDAADKNTQKAFFDIAKATIYGLNYDKAEQILTALDCESTTDGIDEEISADQSSYAYSVDANIVMLFIEAKKAN